MDPEARFREIIFDYRWYILGVVVGVILIALGIFAATRQLPFFENNKVEILSAEDESKETTVEINGAVIKPGVYKLTGSSRIDDALIVAGGLSANADRDWIAKTLNRAAKLSDGQKIYIPEVGSQMSDVRNQKSSTSDKNVSGLININSASATELDKLPGVGQVTAQKIIDNRPYSAVEELITRKILKQKVYEDIKDKVSIY